MHVATRGRRTTSSSTWARTNTEILDSETADSYEIGLKSTLLDDRLILNLAAWDAKYDNFQANNFTFLNGTLITTLTNAGTVTTEGVSLDFLARPMDALALTGGIAYTDAKVDEWFTPPGSTPTRQLTALSCRSRRPGKRTSPPSTRWNSATSTSCRRCCSITRVTSTET